LIPAVIDTAPGLSVLSSNVGGAGEVYVHFRLGDDARPQFLYCRFAGSGLSFRKRVLTRVVLNGASLSAAATFFLREGWLTSQDAIAAEPQPKSGRVPEIPRALAYGLQQGLAALPKLGIYALMAASYALIYGLVGRINLAFGALTAIGGMVAVLALMAFDLTGFATLPYGLAVGLWASWTTGAVYALALSRGVIEPMAFRSGQAALIASVGLSLVLSEFLRIAQGANSLWLPPILNATIVVARAPDFAVTLTPMALVIAALAGVAALLLVWQMRVTRFGRQWRATAEDPLAAELFGINPRDLVGQTFGFAAALAALAGALVVLHYGGIGFAGGAQFGLTALVAAVLGGIGSVGAAMAGGVLIGLIEAVWSALLPIEHRETALYSLLALALIFRPTGLFGGRDTAPMRV